MIYPVQYLDVTDALTHDEVYSVTINSLLTNVRFIIQPKIVFHNPDASSCLFTLSYGVSQSGVFSDSYGIVEETLTAGNRYVYECEDNLVRENSYVSYSATITNLDTVARSFYLIVSGWTDLKLSLNAQIYTIGYSA